VLWKDSAQADAWDAAGEMVVKGSMQGYQGCVMCYGQTGSGKTYTLGNNEVGNEGIIVRAIDYIFNQARPPHSAAPRSTAAHSAWRMRG
jgi:hypothetical protein